jgi:predicted MFS family arabinose efflux permease
MGAAAAGAAASGLGFAVLSGRVLAGYCLDRWNVGWVAWFLLTIAGVGALLLATESSAWVQPGVLLIGFGVGTEGDLLAFLLSRRFPLRSFGTVYGLLFSVHALGAGVGGLLAGASYDWSGGYALWLVSAAAMLIAAGIIALASERNAVLALPAANR